MRISIAVAVACLGLAGITHAGDASAVIRKPTNIPAQTLRPALQQLSQERDLQLVFRTDLVGDLKTNGVRGDLTFDEAVGQLLDGTGLTHRYLNEKTVTILPLATAPAITGKDGATSVGKEAQKNSFWERFRVAQADTSASGVKKAEESAKIEEVVVTAQKREERLMDVPQSVTALSADELTRSGVLQFRDYADTVPGMAYATTGAGYTQIVLRGVTTGYESGAPVAVYVDDVPVGDSSVYTNSTRMALDANLFDLERIEVLKGPQGTLYGAGAAGGLVKYVSKRPSSEQLDRQVHFGLASTAHGGLSRNAAGAINLPLSAGKAGLRVSGFYNHDGGYIDNLSLGRDDVNQANIYGGRADLVLTPTERFSARLAAFVQNISRDGEGTAEFTTAGSPTDSEVTQRRPMAEPFGQKMRMVSATLNYDFDWAVLTSVSGYNEVDSRFVQDLTEYYRPFWPSPYSALGSFNAYDTDKFVQEIRLTSASGKRLEWVVGGFYSDADAFLTGRTIWNDLNGQPVPTEDATGATPVAMKDYAGFGTLTWHFTDTFDVSGGIRYSKNKQKFQYVYPGLITPEESGTTDATTYLANARYAFNDRSMLYARYATGYRTGGPNGPYQDRITFQFVPVGPFDADTLSSYEVGFRRETADRRFSMDAAAFYIDWKDVIIRAYDASNGASYYDNAAGMKVRGGELALTARPVRSLTFAAAMAYTDAYMAEANATLGAVKGERMPTSPRFTANLTADYAFSGARFEPRLGAAFRYTGDRKVSFDQNPGFPQYLMDAYTAVDVHGGLSSDSYDVQLYVRNLLDEQGEVSGYTWEGNPRLAIQQPRTIGFTVTTRF